MNSLLDQTLLNGIFTAFLIFTRVGTAFMLMPGIGDSYVPIRVRLLFAGAVSVALMPLIGTMLPRVPAGFMVFAVLLGKESLIGFFLGSVARLMLSALDTAGMLIAQNLGLANAFVLNPALQTQGSLTGSLMSMLGVVLIFVTDLDHLVLRAIVSSYQVFPPGGPLMAGDMAAAFTRAVADTFRIGIEMAAPFLLVAIVFFIGLGLVARLMPQMQVFFLATPVQMLGGFVLFALTLSAGMLYWLKAFQDSMSVFPG